MNLFNLFVTENEKILGFTDSFLFFNFTTA